MEKEIHPKVQPKSKAAFYLLMSAGTAILLATPVVVLLLFGILIDKYFHTGPTFMIAGTVVGAVGGVYNVYRLMRVMK